MLKNLFNYAGSKNKFFKIYDEKNILPKGYTLSSYSESFCGSCAIFYNLLNKGVISEKTVVYLNDLNSDIINLLAYLKDSRWVDVEKDCSNYEVLSDKEKYEKLKIIYKQGNHPLSWLQLISNTWGGFYSSNGKFYRDKNFKKKTFNLKNLQSWSEVLKTHNINISCKDYHEVPVCEFNFVDPPYIKSDKRHYGGVEVPLMSEILNKYKGSYSVICNNYSESWENIGYQLHKFDVKLNLTKRVRTEVAIEIKPFPSERKALALTI